MAEANQGAIAPSFDTTEAAQVVEAARVEFSVQLEQATEITVRDGTSVENLVEQMEGVENAAEIANDLLQELPLYHGHAEGRSVSYLRGLRMTNGGGVRQYRYHIRFCT